MFAGVKNFLYLDIIIRYMFVDVYSSLASTAALLLPCCSLETQVNSAELADDTVVAELPRVRFQKLR